MNRSTPPRPPRGTLALLSVLLRGHGSDFVIGDLLERFADDLEDGMTAGRARSRFRRLALASCLAWWAPHAVRERRRWEADEEWRRRPIGSRRPSPATWAKEIGVAVRSLRRRPAFSLSVACTLGLGIGATTTMFSVVDGVLLKPLPYEEPSSLVAIGTVFPTRPWADEEAGLQHLAGISMLNYLDFAERNRALQSVAASEQISVLFPDHGAGPEIVPAARASADYLALLGVSPALGRSFLADDFRGDAEPVVLLSHGAWMRRFGGRPEVVGSALGATGTGGVVVGVLPEDFRPPEAFFNQSPEVWLPLREDHPRYASRGMRSLAVIGRLAPGVTAAEARAEADAIADQLAIDHPDGNVYPDGSHFGIGVNLLSRQTIGGAGRTLRIFMGAAALLLLLACVNAATLFFARALDRVQEIDVRRALGAGRASLARLLLLEAGLLAILAGAAGVLLTVAGVEAFLRFAPSDIPRLDSVGVDARGLGVAAAISLGTGLLAGMLPALRRQDSVGATFSARGATGLLAAGRFRTGMVGAQIALATVLLSGAALLSKSFYGMVTESPGFDPEGIVSMSIALKRPGAAAVPSWQDWEYALEELRTVGGTTAVAGTSNPPFQSPSWAPRLLLPGDAEDLWREGIAGYVITPGYLDALGVEVLDGRGFHGLDGPDAERVALVNESFVRTQLGGEDPLGLILRQREGDVETEARVVGVVPDMVQTSVDEGRRPAVYFPHTQVEWPALHAIVRSPVPPEILVPEIRQALARFSPMVPPRDVQTMHARIAASRTQPRFQAALIGSFSAVALLLAALGLYASLTHAIGRRQRELGVRMALGADRGRVARLVVGQGLVAAGGGLLLGLVGAWWSTRLLTGFLYEVSPYDPSAIVGVAVVLAIAALLSSLGPARRAVTVDPLEALRAD